MVLEVVVKLLWNKKKTEEATRENPSFRFEIGDEFGDVCAKVGANDRQQIKGLRVDCS
jgi:hypothetical protein